MSLLWANYNFILASVHSIKSTRNILAWDRPPLLAMLRFRKRLLLKVLIYSDILKLKLSSSQTTFDNFTFNQLWHRTVFLIWEFVTFLESLISTIYISSMKYNGVWPPILRGGPCSEADDRDPEGLFTWLSGSYTSIHPSQDPPRDTWLKQKVTIIYNCTAKVSNWL